MKTIIIGGAGYIGGGILEQSSDKSYAVVDNLLFEDRYLRTDVDFFNIDVRNPENLNSIIHDYDVAIVLAGLVGDPACAVNPQMTWDTNLKHVKWIADNFKGKIVYTSTCSVYGKNDQLLDENSPTNPLSLYAESKLEAEQYITSNRPESLVYRLGTLYGKSDSFSRPRLDLVINVLSMRAALGKTLKVFGGEQWRPFLHVKDVANAILFGIDNNISGLYNLSQQNMILSEAAEIIVNRVPGSSIEYDDMPFEDMRNYKVKNDKLLAIGFIPEFTLEQGIDEIVEMFNSDRIKDPYNSIYHNGNYMKEHYG